MFISPFSYCISKPLKSKGSFDAPLAETRLETLPSSSFFECGFAVRQSTVRKAVAAENCLLTSKNGSHVHRL